VSAQDSLALLAAAPRFALGHWPTPLEPCHRLRKTVGGPLVWLKRDDCSGLAVGGNKTRKLEYLLGRAIADGCSGVVTFGALQSNHARQTAAACAKAGMSCDLVLTRAVDRSDEHYLRSGNLLLDQVLGATLHVVDDPDAAFVRFAELLDAAQAEGRSLYGIVPGGSDPVGTLGYVQGALELAEQARAHGIQPRQVVVAASTAGTAAGLTLGSQLAGWDVSIEAACVYHGADETEAELVGLLAATADALDMAAEPQRCRIDDSALGEGYGIPSEAGQAAIELLARTEGVLLDPVYTGKAVALLLARIAEGSLDDSEDVVVVHTGGSPGLFAYAPEWGVGAER
jgi:D-cysteine desulfhydrase family pyridoxal phosphate-dependent enzyme